MPSLEEQAAVARTEGARAEQEAARAEEQAAIASAERANAEAQELIVAPVVGLTTFPESLIGAVAGGGALYLIAIAGSAVFGKESMGGGDIKLAAMLGAFLGWQGVIVFLFIAFFVGAVVGVAVLAARRSEGDHTVPFGPFIALGAFVTMVWGEAIVRWYLSTLGGGG